MKILRNILFLTFLFIVCINNTYAAYYGVLKDDVKTGEYYNTGFYIRKIPSTLTKDGDYGLVRAGSVFKLVSNDLHENISGCPEGWYKFYYSGTKTGYMCKRYMDVYERKEDGAAPLTECETAMSNAGFPASYWGGLCYLKSEYPNWQFKAVNTNLDFLTSVVKESACRISYTASTNPEYIDDTCIGQYATTWSPASKMAVAEKLDTRNALSPRWIFQFEKLSFDNDFENYYRAGVTSIIKDTSFYNIHKDYIVNDIVTGTKAAGISPIHFASRTLQELGSGNSLLGLFNGTTPGYEGYYNFINYGVSDHCATTDDPVICGLKTAKHTSNNWNSVLAAVEGGARKIGAEYISVGQDSLYLQKFNVLPHNQKKLYDHQYQTNIGAPNSESSTMFVAYNKMGLINSSFLFSIPIYNNQNAVIPNTGSGASGLEKDDPVDIPVSTIVISAGYKYSKGFVFDILSNTNAKDLRNTISTLSGYGNAVIYSKTGKVIEDKILSTGDRIKIINTSGEETLEIVIKGDTSGDGEVNALDLLQIQKHILELNKLDGANSLAADTSGDGVINALDLLQVQKHILELERLK